MSRRTAGLTALLAVCLLVSGCTSPAPDDTQEARSATDEFLRSLADGRSSQALALSTSTPDDLACPETADDANRAPAIAAPSVDSIEVRGDSATAAVSYRAPEAVSTTLELDRRDGSWKVKVPDEWTLVVGFDGPTLAEVRVDDTCVILAGDAPGLTWPGRYRVAVADPTGVLERTENFLVEVPGGGTTGYDGDPSTLAAVPGDALNALRAEAAPLLAAAFDRCAAGAACPAGLRGASADAQPSAASLTIDRVWTDDARSWRFETPQNLSPAFRGTLSRDDQGELVIALDET